MGFKKGSDMIQLRFLKKKKNLSGCFGGILEVERLKKNSRKTNTLIKKRGKRYEKRFFTKEDT